MIALFSCLIKKFTFAQNIYKYRNISTNHDYHQSNILIINCHKSHSELSFADASDVLKYVCWAELRPDLLEEITAFRQALYLTLEECNNPGLTHSSAERRQHSFLAVSSDGKGHAK